MRLMDLDTARERVAPFADSLLLKPCLTAVENWNQFVTTVPKLAASIDRTTRANMIHDFMETAVRGGITEGAREISGFGFFAVLVGNDLAVRYKHVAAAQPSNVATDKQVELARHRYDDELMEALALDGLVEPPTLTTCGYKLNAAGQAKAVFLQCDYGKMTLWRHYLYGEPGVAGVYEVLPLNPDDNLLGTTVVRSKRKDADRSDREAQ